MVGRGAARGEAKVRAHAHARDARRGASVEAQRAAHARAEAVGADDEPAAAQVAADAQADRAPPLDDGALDGRVLEDAHAGRGARRRDERLVEPEAALRQHRRGRAVDVGEGALGLQAEAVIAHARDANAAHGAQQPEPPQHGDARGHDALAAGLFARKAVAVVELDREARAPQHDGERGARGAGARDQDVGHAAPDARDSRGTNRGLPDIVAT